MVYLMQGTPCGLPVTYLQIIVHHLLSYAVAETNVNNLNHAKRFI